MGWTWAYQDEFGSERGRSAAFDTREAAEEWLSESWSGLLDDGTAEVALLESGRTEPLYRMRLSPEEEIPDQQ